MNGIESVGERPLTILPPVGVSAVGEFALGFAGINAGGDSLGTSAINPFLASRCLRPCCPCPSCPCPSCPCPSCPCPSCPSCPCPSCSIASCSSADRFNRICESASTGSSRSALSIFLSENGNSREPNESNEGVDSSIASDCLSALLFASGASLLSISLPFALSSFNCSRSMASIFSIMATF